MAPAFNGITHPKCRRKYGLDGVIPVIVYKGIVKKLLYQFKYSPYLSGLAPILSEILYEGLIQNEHFYKVLEDNPIFVPVPLHAIRLKSRGYNHAGLLTEGLATKLGYSYVAQYLIRTINTKPQYKLKKEERLKNIKGAFSLNSKYLKSVTGKTIVLVDDITTSFATLAECAKVLKHSGASQVYGVTLAKEA